MTSMAEEHRAADGTWPIVAALLALAAGIRLPALFTDFWLDEIQSYEQFARPATSWVDIFINHAFKHDNNHHLNTLMLYVLRDYDGWVIYRWLAFSAGLLTVGLSIGLASRARRVEGVLSGFLVAVSFMMVVYSTQARGYALVL